MPKRTRDHHAWLLDQLTDPVVAADYLNEARRDSRKILLKALRTVAESRRIAVVADETGLSRESLYKSLSGDGNPRLETYDSVLSALGLDYEYIAKYHLISKRAQKTVPGVSISTPTSENFALGEVASQIGVGLEMLTQEIISLTVEFAGSVQPGAKKDIEAGNSELALVA